MTLVALGTHPSQKPSVAFRRAKPSRLSPTAMGTFDARAYFDPKDRKWRIAARYIAPSETPDVALGRMQPE